jgi:integrase
MAGLIKRKGIYYAQFKDKSKASPVRRISLDTKLKAEARKKLFELETRYKASEWCPWKIDSPKSLNEPAQLKTLSEATDAFLSTKQAQGCSDNTYRTYHEVLSLAQRFLGSDAPLAHISDEQLSAFVSAKHLSAATRHKRYGHLRTFCRWLVRTKSITANPIEAIEAPGRPQKLPKAITTIELAAICDTIQKDYEEKLAIGHTREGEMIWRIPLYWFSYLTGMRPSEVARLRWRDIDYRARTITIWEQKNGKEQTIPLTYRVEVELSKVPRANPQEYVFSSPRQKRLNRSVRTFVERASRAFRDAKRRAGITRRITFYGTRHGFCTLLAEKGRNAPLIAAAARHADVSTTMKYIHMANDHLRRELDIVFSQDEHDSEPTLTIDSNVLVDN